MRVAGHRLVVAGSQHGFGAVARVAPPKAKQRFRIELQGRTGVNPFASELRSSL